MSLSVGAVETYNTAHLNAPSAAGYPASVRKAVRAIFRDSWYSARSASAYATAEASALTVKTAGQAPIFLANGCEAPNAATYVAASVPVVPGPVDRSHSRPHITPPAARTMPPSGRRPV